MGSFQDSRENVHQPRNVPVFRNITYLPSYQQVQYADADSEGLSWWQQRALDLKITTMAQPTKPYWNTTMVTAWVAVIVGFFTIMGSIGALYLYTDSVAEQRGLEKGRQQAEQQQLQMRLEKTEEELRRVKDLKLVQSGQQTGHTKEK